MVFYGQIPELIKSRRCYNKISIFCRYCALVKCMYGSSVASPILAITLKLKELLKMELLSHCTFCSDIVLQHDFQGQQRHLGINKLISNRMLVRLLSKLIYHNSLKARKFSHLKWKFLKSGMKIGLTSTKSQIWSIHWAITSPLTL